MVRVLAILVCVGWACLDARAEVPWLTTTGAPIPEIHPGEAFPLARTSASPVSDSHSVNVSAVASALETQFQQALLPLAKPQPACFDPAGEDYVYALYVAGRLADCADYARTCTSETRLTSPVVLTYGAICEAQRFRWHEAEDLFKSAIGDSLRGSIQFAFALSHYALFAMTNGLEDRVEEILKRHPQWSKTDQQLARALLARAARLDTGTADRGEMDRFLEGWRSASQGRLAEFLTVLRGRIDFNEGRYEQALKFAAKEFPQLHDPMSWYYLAFMIFYHGLDGNFAQAKAIFDAYDSFAQPWWQLPIENNVFTYSEIYSRECQSSTLQGAERTEFGRLKKSLRDGRLPIDQALGKMRDWRLRYPDHVDVLTALGGLLSLLGQHDEAEQHLWRAHRLCRYFNRAHWGLALTYRTRKFMSLPDYASNLRRMERELSGVVIPTTVEQYFLNWNSFDDVSHQRVIFGARVYMAHLGPFAHQKLKAYLKFSYDLLSESPGNSSLRDERIGGGKYPFDHRLWDDVRGAGGQIVVADIHEVMDSPLGSYNLLGHEMAHQLQSFMSVTYPKGVDRIHELYVEALANGNFPDKYSSNNMEEHFAQGVTYFLVTPDAPTRFGLNRSWLTRHNPAQEQFIIEVTGSVPGTRP